MFHALHQRLCLAALSLVLLPAAAHAETQRERIDRFLHITGFDVALESIRLSARDAPAMLGMEADAFGSSFEVVSDDVFRTDAMLEMAVDLLEPTLTPDLLDHALDFYASPLGKRIVIAENASHLKDDDDAKTEAGESIIAGLVRIGSSRVATLRRMNAAIDASDNAVRAVHDVQVRFLMAAAGAGVIELRLEEPDLRRLLSSQEGDLRVAIQMSALTSSAYTYQAFSDDEIAAYAAALEDPRMQQVYELMNAVQFEVMANRFEALARRLAALQPETDL